MKILMISTDFRILDKNSQSRARIIDYGKILDEIHVILFSLGKNEDQKMSENVFVYPTNSANKLLRYFDGFSSLKRIKSKIDWVIAQDPFENGVMGLFFSKKLKSKLQIQVHTDLFNENFIRESIRNRIRVLIAKCLLKKADKIRVVSNKIKRDIIQKLGILEEKIFVLPLFIDVEKIRNSSINTNLKKKYPQFKKIILMASRLSKEKNISLALKSVNGLNDVGLIIVGNGPVEDKLKKEAPQNVIFENWTNDLYSYYKTADLFLITSKYEGYGMTIVEAVASGIPVLSTNVGIAEECEIGISDEKNLRNDIQRILYESKKVGEYKLINKSEYLREFKKNLE